MRINELFSCILIVKKSNMETNQEDLFHQLQTSQKLKTVQVPTKDIDVQYALRKLGEPICFFGEGPKERKDRLRLLLIGKVINLNEEAELPEMIPKIIHGTGIIQETKKAFIDFSIQRAKKRIQHEREIDQERIDQTNSQGAIFSNYETFLSCAVDKRPLVSIASCDDAILVGGLSSKATLWSYQNKYESPIFEYTNHKERITCVNFLNNAITMTSSADQTVRFYDESDEICVLKLNSVPRVISGHPMGCHSLVGMNDGDLIVHDVSTQQIVSKMKAHDGMVSSLCCHTDGGLVMTGGADFYGRLWDLRSMKVVKVMQGHSNRLTCATFDNDFHVVSGGADNFIIVWDLRNLSRSKKISAHTSVISGVHVSGDILVSSASESVKIWSMLDFRTYKVIEDCLSPILGVTMARNSFSPFPSIFTCSHDGSWRMYIDGNCDIAY